LNVLTKLSEMPFDSGLWNGSEAGHEIDRQCYLDFYNGRRPHSSLDRRTPKSVDPSPNFGWLAEAARS
jgi:hypothetical protein